MAVGGAKLWLISTLKGEVRKSTSAMMLGFALADRGEEVLIVDADHGTQGVTDWASRVYADEGELPFHVISHEMIRADRDAASRARCVAFGGWPAAAPGPRMPSARAGPGGRTVRGRAV
ncbi:nucleotide-binding protein [Actinocorallia populi]|uniref:nucleotide-binding protein n=1 Tax=Actinocorallia populi TaxID=2079200 RepID=UPI000D09002B|nr:ParA family protein [Actinocorallia populi]